tara:strand:- start:119 stop:388 length:270 start_codon:yes stop_codon:yes gene_type:complete
MKILFNGLAVFGAIVVGLQNAHLFWLLLLALLILNSILLNPFIFGKIQEQIKDGEIGDVAKTLFSTYIYGVFLVGVFYGIGRLFVWLAN